MSKFGSMRGLVAFVTGAASGIGRGTAEHLIRQGAKVAIADLPSSVGANVAQEFGSGNAVFTPLDVSNSDDVLKALRLTEKRFGRIDALVNCAALGMARSIYNITEKRPPKLEEFERLLKVNVGGTFNVMRLGVEFLNKNEPSADGKRGVVINTSGFSAFEGAQAQSFYAAACGAIVSMTLPASRDLSRCGIRVVTICPGIFNSPLVSYLPENVRTYLGEQVLSPPRFGEPREFGHLVQHVIENSYLNGEVIRLDGGVRVPP